MISVKNINIFSPMKPNVGFLLKNGHENQNSNKDLLFRHNKSYPIHPSLCAFSLQLFESINISHNTQPSQDISGPKQ
jgi:hypothetical protein